MTNTKNTTGILAVAFAVLVMLAIPFALAPKAHAADLDTWGDYYPMSVGGGDTWGDYYPVGGDTWGDYYPSTYGDTWGDYYPTDYGYGGGYYGGGSTMGGMGGGFPFSTMGGASGGMRQSQSQSQSSTNVNTNTNACTSGSCNTAINAPTNIVVSNPAPQQPVVYAQPYVQSYPVSAPIYPTTQYDMCPNIAGIQPTLPTGYYMQGSNCFYYTQPSQPYVTLAAVPYTGLDLGPMGTALYWGFLVLWCLVAAYLIAVKKIQNRIAAWFFKSDDAKATLVAHSAPKVAHAAPAAPIAPASTQFAGIDPFIASQIARISK